jgi:predicted RNA-binding Zn ribbon-like protein
VASPERERGYQFDLSGGILCLDFANTVSRRKDPRGSIDHLTSYGDLTGFFEQSKLLSHQRASELQAQARRNRSAAERVLRKAITLRERLFSAFSAIAAGNPAELDDLRSLEEAALEALKHRELAPVKGGYRWKWNDDGHRALDWILWPIAQSAADLLTSEELPAVRECEAPTCAWLFLDRSRNRSRRWCDMTVCGNRQKARRHYQRTHS